MLLQDGQGPGGLAPAPGEAADRNYIPNQEVPGQTPVEGTQDKGGGGLFGDNMLVPLILIMVVFYVLMIGPERRNRKKREQMLKALAKGDRVMTTSGIYGTIAQIQDDVVTVQVAEGVRLRMSRQAIQGIEGEQEEKEPAKK